ncbi:PH domain-containing protein, partial [Haematococcus lacustris]
QEQQGLQRWQDKERSFLNTAFSQAKDLEAARLELVQQVLATASEVYQAAALPLQPELQRMAQACAAPCVWGTLGADQAGQQLSELTKAAATASEAAGMLAARQAESMQAASAELFCSPEIVFQGPLELWEEAAGRWQPGHAVLTRAGFLHWLRGDGCLPPACSIALARAQLESSQPPLITLNAGPSQQAAGWGVLGSLLGALRVRRLTLRAPSTDSCCEWVLA